MIPNRNLDTFVFWPSRLNLGSTWTVSGQNVQNMNLRFFSTFWSDFPGCPLPAAASSNQPTATCRESAGVGMTVGTVGTVGGTKLWRIDKVQNQAGDGKLGKRIMTQRNLPTPQSRTTKQERGKKKQDKTIVLKTTVSWTPLWKTWVTIYSVWRETVKCTNQKLS